MAALTYTLMKSTTNVSLSRAANVVTVTTTDAVTRVVGDEIQITGSTAATNSFNGTFTISEVTSTTVWKYIQVGATESATAPGSTVGDYSSIRDWESAIDGVAGVTDSVTLYCHTGTFTESDFCTIVGWANPTATYPLVIEAAAGHEHGGVDGDGCIIKSAATSNGTLKVREQYVRIRDITLINTYTAAANGGALNVAAGGEYCIAERLILKCESNATSGIDILTVAGSNENSVLRNIWITGTGYRGFFLNTNSGVKLVNCTVACTANTGIYASTSTTGSGLVAINCVSHGNTTDWAAAGTVTGTTNNWSEDGNHPVDGSGYGTSVDADFESWPTDLRPAAAGDLAGGATDQSSDFTDDIAGDTR